MMTMINCCAEARWIAAETGYDLVMVHRVLIEDLRYLEQMGLVSGPPVENHEVQDPTMRGPK